MVGAYRLPAGAHARYHPFAASPLADLREHWEAVLQDTAAALRRDFPTLDISTQLSYGEPADVLRHASAEAVLTVIGVRGPGVAVVSARGAG